MRCGIVPKQMRVGKAIVHVASVRSGDHLFLCSSFTYTFTLSCICCDDMYYYSKVEYEKLISLFQLPGSFCDAHNCCRCTEVSPCDFEAKKDPVRRGNGNEDRRPRSERNCDPGHRGKSASKWRR